MDSFEEYTSAERSLALYLEKESYQQTDEDKKRSFAKHSRKSTPKSEPDKQQIELLNLKPLVNYQHRPNMASQKRKFHALLDAIGTRSPDDLPNKTPRTASSSFASTLNGSTTSAPTIASTRTEAVGRMSRLDFRNAAARRKISAEKEKNGVKPTYLPADRAEFLKRLESYRNVRDWMPKPAEINEVVWAKKGWKCSGAERVRCVTCNVELVVKLSKQEAGTKPKVVAPDAMEKALITKYISLSTTSHAPECPWRTRGCDDQIYHQPIYPVSQTIAAFKAHYHSLLSMSALLPAEDVFKLPEGFDIEHVISSLPPSFTTPDPEPKAEQTKPALSIRSSLALSSVATTPAPDPEPEAAELNRPALLLALFGFQARPDYVPKLGSADCRLCFRNIGLWLHRPKSCDDTTKPRDLDVIDYHRSYCPWVNGESQNPSAKKAEDKTPLWKVLQRLLEEGSKKRDGGEVVKKISRASFGETDEGNEEFERKRREQEKETWSRLAKIKALFVKKDTMGAGKK